MLKKILNIFSWFLILTSPIWIIALLGFAAIQFDVWPPSCNILPLKEAKRVCEFSKLDKAPANKPATVSFWVTVPSNTNTNKIFLAIDGRESVLMEKINETSFQKTIQATTGETLKYSYQRGTPSSVSDQKTHSVKSFEKKVYDDVSSWSDLSPSLAVDKKIVNAIDMKDTWTINYNMNLFEDTRRNLDSSMARIKALGGKEIGVFSFIDMSGDKEHLVVTETVSPYYHWRDAAITKGEMKDIVKTAKKYGLRTIIHYNVGADYNKYYNVSPFGVFMGQAGSGVGGDKAESQAGKDIGREESKTKEYLDSEFSQLQAILVEWAERAEVAGIDAIDITPQYRMPSYAPLDKYADEKYSEIIKAMRAVYHGGIYGSNFAAYGGFSKGYKPKFIDELDRLTVYVARINVRPGASLAEMRQAHAHFLDVVEKDFVDYRKPIFLAIPEASYEGTTSGKPGREWGDWQEVLAAGYKEGWQEQADSFEAFFQALSGRTKFSGVIAHYWWDDFMAPKYMGTLNNMEGTIRNKPAEAVWKKWLLPIK